jgi:glyoxylase-like metal-dependent hydrolase (beta-lactamase superfamily II)
MTDLSNIVLEIHAVGPMQCNCSIFGCQSSRDCIVVDPGGDADLILDRVTALGLNVRYVLITHAHFDHVLAARAIKNETGAEICVHPKDKWLYRIAFIQYRLFGIKGDSPPRPDWWLAEGDQIPIGCYHADVIHTPGHSPGSCCFHVAEEKLLFSGDTLFRRSVGQWTYPGGSFAALTKSILQKLFLLPDDTRVIPGHGEETTIGEERELNPYLKPGKIAELQLEEENKPGVLKQIFSLVAGLVFQHN